ncbi:MAG: hypothetical protein CL870_00535 [Cytophagia bacterium]|jgi:hypothetical protein|nr:hypothetical protein [Cytophagia bacterium]
MMKRLYSFFFLLLFITFLVADSVSHHHHDKTDSEGIVNHQNVEDCKLCLFSNVSSNSDPNFQIKSSINKKRLDISSINYELVNYTKSFNHSLSLRGPPKIS